MKNFSLLFLMLLMFNAFGKKWDATYIGKLVAKGEVDKVIDFYKGRYYGENRNPQDAFKIAELYVKKKQYADAIQWYDKESQLINTSKVNLFNYANTNRLMGEYQKALDGYLMYAALTGDVNKVMDLANQCEKILKSSALAYNYKLENYTYNTANDETNIGVLRTNPIYITIENSTNKKSESSYTVYQIVREFENFSTPVKSYKNNVPKLIITSISFSKDGNAAVFSAIDEKAISKNGKAKNEQIFTADYLGGDFLNVKPFPFHVDGYSQKNPAFNADATALYFASNQAGGFGGFDIWKSTWSNHNWTTPKNLGKLLNSSANETNPFMVQDETNNTLYFSSDRDGGYGGFDIYRASFTDSIWQDVQLQAAPINSAGDDISIIYDADINTGYFSSNRMGGKGGFDIYRFIPFNLKLNVNTKDTFSEKSIGYAFVQVFENNEKLFDGVTNENGNAVFQINKNNTYTLKISKDGFRPLIVKVNSNGKGSGDSIVTDVLLKPDAQFSISKGATNNLSLDNYIFFTGRVIDAATNKPAYTAKMRMVNYTTQKLREVDIDSSGRFEIKLLLNNSYKVIFESQENKITDELSTYGLEKNNIKVRDYVLSGSKFKLTENRVYDANSLPPTIHLKLDSDKKKAVIIKNNVVVNEPITQTKIDSLLKVISKDNPVKTKVITVAVPTPTIQNNVVAEVKAAPTSEVTPIVNADEKTKVVIPTIIQPETKIENVVVVEPILQKDTVAVVTTPVVEITQPYVVIKKEQEPLLAADMVSTKNVKKEKGKIIKDEANLELETPIKTDTIIVEKTNPIKDVGTSKPIIVKASEVITSKIVATPVPIIENKQAPNPIAEKIKPAIPIQKNTTTKTLPPTQNTETPTQETLPENYYKIQLASYDVNNIKFPEFEYLGKIEVVRAYDRYVYRIGNFENLEKAKEVLDLVRSKGYFVAFILQYNKEKITGIVN